MPEIYRKLEWLSKEDLIKRVVSHEFNRFAEYYRHRPGIEQPTIESRSERARKSDRKENGFEKRSRKAAPGFNRLFINLGKTDSFFPSDLIGLLNSNTRGRIELGRIDLMQNFSFFEVPEKETVNVLKALNRAKWNGRKVVVEVSSEEGGKGHENGSGERKGGKRSGKTKSALHAMKIKTENLRMLLPKVQNPARRKNQAVQSGDIRMPADRKGKITGRNFSKIKNPTLVKKDGREESPKATLIFREIEGVSNDKLFKPLTHPHSIILMKVLLFQIFFFISLYCRGGIPNF